MIPKGGNEQEVMRRASLVCVLYCVAMLPLILILDIGPDWRAVVLGMVFGTTTSIGYIFGYIEGQESKK